LNGAERNWIRWNEFNIIPPLTINFVLLLFKISKQWNEIFISFRSPSHFTPLYSNPLRSITFHQSKQNLNFQLKPNKHTNIMKKQTNKHILNDIQSKIIKLQENLLKTSISNKKVCLWHMCIERFLLGGRNSFCLFVIINLVKTLLL
jgi:hypothetical protein